MLLKIRDSRFEYKESGMVLVKRYMKFDNKNATCSPVDFKGVSSVVDLC